jgi:hypothetical protein
MSPRDPMHIPLVGTETNAFGFSKGEKVDSIRARGTKNAGGSSGMFGPEEESMRS